MISCPPSTDGLHLYPYDFTKYINCQQGHMSIIECAPQNVFSISRRRCLPEIQVNIADRVRNAWELRHNVDTTDCKFVVIKIVTFFKIHFQFDFSQECSTQLHE